MKNNRIWIGLVILLILVNCGLLGFLWHTSFRPQPHNLPGQAYEYLTRELKLNAQQRQQYTAMREKHFSFTRKLSEENRALRDSFFNEVKTPVLNKASADRLEQKLSANQQKLDSATLYHFREFRAILSSEQQKKFDGLLSNVLHMMGNPRPHGPGGGNGPGPNGQEQQGPPPGADGQGPPPGGQGPPPGN